MVALSLLDRLGEFVSLRRAEATIRSYSASRQQRVALHRLGGDRRFRAARRATDPLAAAILYREAALCYERAWAAARPRPGEAQAGDLVERQTGDPAGQPAATRDLVELIGWMGPWPTDPLGPARAEDVERARAALSAADPAFFDRLDRDELERTRAVLERGVSRLRGAIEGRSLVNVQATRLGRMCALVLVLAAVAYRAAAAIFWPDVAEGKVVGASSLKAGVPEDLVSGGIGTSYAMATQAQDAPWIAVDLGRVYRITKVEVYNRVDGWFDDNLPLVLEISAEGSRWNDVSRRTTTFGHDPPWIVRLARQPARYVRVQGVGHMSLALSKIRVYAAN